MRLNLGCGNDIREGWVNVDHPGAVSLLPNPGNHELIGCDLDAPSLRLPLDNNTVTEILAQQVLEHIRNLLPLLQELHRVTVPGGELKVSVPYGGADGAWADPTHVRAFFIDSWIYFRQPTYCFSNYGYKGDWEPQGIGIVMNQKEYGDPVDMGKVRRDLMFQRNKASEMRCVLEAIKPIRLPVPGHKFDKPECPVRILFRDDTEDTK